MVRVSQTTQNLVIFVVVLHRVAKKFTKTYNGRSQLLLCSLNLLFSDVLVAVVVVICLQLFRERLSNKTVRDNAERYYG